MGIETKVKLLKRRRTKIVATLGPSSSDRAVIEALIRAGVDVFRLNMSHGDHEGHRRNLATIRELSEAHDWPVAVLADLCGPKIRTGKFQGGSIPLVEGEPVTVTTRDVAGVPGLIPSQYEPLARDVRTGDRILLDDGTLELEVLEIDGTEVSCRVTRGGTLKNHKGMNLPGVELSTPSVTDRDRDDARFAAELGVEYLALSFVRRAEDVAELGRFLDEGGWRDQVGIIAKIEMPQALEAIDEILQVADGIMVARGDLGVELPPEEVPVAQDLLVDCARAASKPVIVATQMLESMVTQGRPTRAEVSDISHAVGSGADAVMLSAETAAGRYPIEAVRVMDRTARQSEGYLWQQTAFGTLSSQGILKDQDPTARAVSRATALLSRDLQVRAIVVVSRNGITARSLCSGRPAAPLVAISSSLRTARRMNLLWGVLPVHRPDLDGSDLAGLARRLVADHDLACPGEPVLLVRGFDRDPACSQPSITVLTA